jgi:hypothetical protein
VVLHEAVQSREPHVISLTLACVCRFMSGFCWTGLFRMLRANRDDLGLPNRLRTLLTCAFPASGQSNPCRESRLAAALTKYSDSGHDGNCTLPLSSSTTVAGGASKKPTLASGPTQLADAREKKYCVTA